MKPGHNESGNEADEKKSGVVVSAAAEAAAKPTIPLTDTLKRQFIDLCINKEFNEALVLMRAVSDNDKRILANLIISSRGHTALLSAAYNGHVDIATLLLEYGADPNQARTDNGATALMGATERGYLEVVKLLLEYGADPSQARTDGGGTALMGAAYNGHVDIATLLLERDAKPNQARTDNGATALMLAAHNGHVDIARLLLNHKADPNQARTDGGGTALMAAAQNGHLAIVESLLDYDANPINSLNLLAIFYNHPKYTDAHRLNFDNALRIIIEHDRTNVAFDKPGGFNIGQLDDDVKALIDQLYQIADADNDFEQLWDKITARVRDQEDPVSAILLDYMLQKVVEKGNKEELIAKLRPSVVTEFDGEARRVEEPSLLVEAAIAANLGAVKVLSKYGADIGAMPLGDSVASHVAQYINISASLAQDGESAVAAGVDAVPVEMAESGGAVPKAATAQAVLTSTPAQMIEEKFLPVVRFLIEKSPTIDRSIMKSFEELRLAGIDFISRVPALKAIDEQAQRANAAERELAEFKAWLVDLIGGSSVSLDASGGGKASKSVEVSRVPSSEPTAKPSSQNIKPAHSGGLNSPSRRLPRGLTR